MPTKKHGGSKEKGTDPAPPPFNLNAHFKEVWTIVKGQLDRVEAHNEERFWVLLARFDRLDAELAQRRVAPVATVIVQHDKCETDREKAERYEQKLYKFIASTCIGDARTEHFLQGVLDHIASQRFISTRQSEAVDRIIGEHYA